MAYPLLSRANRAAAVSSTAVPKRKAAPRPRAVDSQPGFEIPVSLPLATSLPSAPVVQTKLKIGEPNDKFEQEADRVAEQVMRIPESQALKRTAISGSTSPPRLQRVCRECEDELSSRPAAIQRMCPDCEAELRRQPIKEGEEEVTFQGKEKSGPSPKRTLEVQAQVDGFLGCGQPLPDSVRAFFEPRFGRDFSGVRVHTDIGAASAASQVNARAFTVGRDIVFGTGAYAPGTVAGKRVIAHELTHVVQQQNTGTPSIQRLTEVEKAENLKSRKYARNARLEKAFDNDPPLGIGESGVAVRLVQEGLAADGFEMPASTKQTGGLDGVFGEETFRVVKEFQIKHGLDVDGIVGRQTMGRLDGLALQGQRLPDCPVAEQPPIASAFTGVPAETSLAFDVGGHTVCKLPSQPPFQLPTPPARPSAPLPRVVSAEPARFNKIAEPSAAKGFNCVKLEQGGFMWSVKYGVHFPIGVEPGLWFSGFVQNMTSDRLEAEYLSTRPVYSVIGPLLDVPDDGIFDPFFDFAIEVTDGAVSLTLLNPDSTFSVTGTGETETFNPGFVDVLCFYVQKRDLRRLRRRTSFRAFLASEHPLSGRLIPHFVSQEYSIETEVTFKVGVQDLETDVGPTTRIAPAEPSFTAITGSSPRPVTSGTTANEASREALKKTNVACVPKIGDPKCGEE